MIPLLVILVALLVAASYGGPVEDGREGHSPVATALGTRRPEPLSLLEQAQTHLRHIIIIVQENRSFDHYFGTFPGADGFPTRDGRINVCVPDPILHACARPYHTSSQLQQGGPHAQRHSRADVDRGAMDGFIQTAIDGKIQCADHRRQGVVPELPGPAGPARRHELPDGSRDPQLLGLRQELRAAGPHVRAGGLVDAAGAPVPRVRLGRALRRSPGPHELLVGPGRADRGADPERATRTCRSGPGRTSPTSSTSAA